jgi:hypothetical protein
MYINNVCKSWGKSDRRRPPGNNRATADGMRAAQRLGVIFLTYMDIYHNSHQNGCQHRQREELAQHAVMRPSCHSRQVAVTIMVHAVATFCICRLRDFVNMKRREYQHRQEYCQQNACWYLSPNYFHGCKGTALQAKSQINLSFLNVVLKLFGYFIYYPYLCSILVNKTFFTMGELQSILSGSDGCHKSSESLMSVKLLFNTTTINKSLLSLQRQRRSSWLATKRLGVWNWKKD